MTDELLPWHCGECKCQTFARIDELQADGHFAPGDDVRCVSCKLVSYWPLASRSSAIVEEPIGYVTAEDFKRLVDDGADAADLTVFQDGSTYGCIPLYASPQPHTGRAGVTEEAKLVAFFNEPAAFAKWGHDGDYDLLSPAETAIRALRAALNAALTVEPEAGEVTVKPLVWKQPAGPWTFVAEIFGITYRVSQGIGDDTKWEARLWNDLLGTYDSEAEAKAAMQSDIDARIRSAIAP